VTPRDVAIAQKTKNKKLEMFLVFTFFLDTVEMHSTVSNVIRKTRTSNGNKVAVSYIHGDKRMRRVRSRCERRTNICPKIESLKWSRPARDIVGQHRVTARG